MKASYAIAFALMAVALGNSSAARADLIVQFGGAGASNDYTYTGGTTQSSLVANISNGSIQLGNTYATGSPIASANNIGVSVNLTSNTAASAPGTLAGTQANFGGDVILTNNTGSSFDGVAAGGTIMTIHLSGVTLVVGSGTASINTTTSGTATITPGLGLQANTIIPPVSFVFGFTGVTSTGSTSSFGFHNFLASDNGNASADIAVGVPEPSTMALAGLGVLGFAAYGLRRRKA